MVSDKNLRFLRQRDGQYIVGTPKAMLRQFERHLTEGAWQQVQPGVEVKLVSGPDGDETFILARSVDRRAKEQAMHQRFLQRLQAGLEKLQAAAASGRLRDPDVANRRLGRLLEKNWRAAKAFQVTIAKLPQPEGRMHLRIDWQRDVAWQEWAELSEGCYLLRSNLMQVDPATLWKSYIQLTDAEWAFRISKDELVLRPSGITASVASAPRVLPGVCPVAQWMRHAGLGEAPRTLVEDFTKIKSGDVVRPAQTANGPHRTIRLRCVTEPDVPQKVLLNRLGLKLPKRLRRLDETARL